MKKRVGPDPKKVIIPAYRLDTEVQVGNVFREITTAIMEKKSDLMVMDSSGTSR